MSKKIVTRTISQDQLWINTLNCSTSRCSMPTQQDWYLLQHTSFLPHYTEKSTQQLSPSTLTLKQLRGDRYPQRSHCQDAQGAAPAHGARSHQHTIGAVTRGCCREWTQPADHMEAPGLLHIEQRGHSIRSSQRRLPHTSTNMRHSALFGKRMGSLTNGSWQGHDHWKLLQHKTRHQLHLSAPQISTNTAGEKHKMGLF